MDEISHAVDWDTAPELWTLEEVVRVTRHSIKTAYNMLGRKQFPIAHLPGLRQYRFPKENVRVWVREGRITNPALSHAPRKPYRARKSRKSNAAA